jgi:hypothetical protein
MPPVHGSPAVVTTVLSFVGLLALLAGLSCRGGGLGGDVDGGAGADRSPDVGAGSEGADAAEDNGCWVTEALTATDDVCVFALPSPPNSNTSNDHIYVWADSLQVIQDQTDVDGWDYTDAVHRTIEIYGPTCDRIRGAAVQAVSVTYFCYGPP